MDLRDHKINYLRSGGTQGHILDFRERGGPILATHCLIRYTGRISGRTLITPLFYGCIGGEVAVIASFLGSDRHPKWYLNLLGSERVDFQIATQAYRATWREAEGADRDAAWSVMDSNMPAFSHYQRRTERRFPVILMRPDEEIPVFSEADLA